jgi:hypothetical protein
MSTFDLVRLRNINYDLTAETLTVEYVNAAAGALFISGNIFNIDVQRTAPTTSAVVTTTAGENLGVADAEGSQIINMSSIGISGADEFTIIYYDQALGPTGPNITVAADTIRCFVRGTLIRTSTGDVRVEDLKVGDYIISVGTLKDRHKLVPYSQPLPKPITRIVTSSLSGKLDSVSRPVKITAGAFGENLPTQDLFVSPWHAFVKDGRLKSAEHMLNGSTINYDHSCESVDYYHLELDEHSAIIANGVETESFYDDRKPPVA